MAFGADRVLARALGAGTAPHADPAHCRRQRLEGDGCRACVVACPVQAWWIDRGGGLRLQDIDCLSCGACASACPSQAIGVPAPDLRGATRAARERGAAVIACRIGPGTSESADAVVPCLAGLAPERLATLFLSHPGASWTLDASRCAGCRLGALRPTIAAHVAQAAAYAARLGVIVAVDVRDDPPPATRGWTRRELLRRARDGAADAAVRAIADEVPPRPAHDAPPYRAALLGAARSHEETSPGPDGRASDDSVLGAFFVGWDVAPACDGCAGAGRPRCVAACPWGAWRLSRGGALSHDAARCVGCGACADTCPAAALSPRAVSATAREGRVVRRRLEMHRCRGCAGPLPVGGDGLCANCRKRASLQPRPSGARPDAD